MAEIKKIIEFKYLPEAVKNWLSSTLITSIILGINRKYGFLETAEKVIVIPGLVLEICTREVDPKETIQKLKDRLGINDFDAKSIAEEIKTKVLKPIGSSLLRDAAVDIEEITSQLPPPVPPTPVPPSPPSLPSPSISSAPSRPTPPPSPAPRPAPVPPVIPSQSSSPSAPSLPPTVKIPINVSQSKPPLPPILPKQNQ